MVFHNFTDFLFFFAHRFLLRMCQQTYNNEFQFCVKSLLYTQLNLSMIVAQLILSLKVKTFQSIWYVSLWAIINLILLRFFFIISFTSIPALLQQYENICGIAGFHVKQSSVLLSLQNLKIVYKYQMGNSIHIQQYYNFMFLNRQTRKIIFKLHLYSRFYGAMAYIGIGCCEVNLNEGSKQIFNNFFRQFRTDG